MRLDPDTPTRWYRYENLSLVVSPARPFSYWKDDIGGADLIASTHLFVLLIPCESDDLAETP